MPTIDVVIRLDTAEYEATLHIADGGTAGDVAGALGRVGGLVVDGKVVPADAPVQGCGIRRGSVLELGGDPAPGPVCRLLAVAGPRAGDGVVLIAGRHDLAALLGADDAADGAGRTVVVDDQGRPWRTDGSAIPPGATIRCGAHVLQVLPGDAAAATDRFGRTVFNRPPRGEYPSAVPPVAAPALPSEPPPTTRFNWAALAVPIVVGAVLATIFGPMMAMVAVLSPVMMIGTWIEERRRGRGEAKRRGAAAADELETFGDRLAKSVVLARRLRWKALPEPRLLIAAAAAGAPDLWQRRRGHPDFMVLGVGSGCIRWVPPVTGDAGPAPIQEILSGVAALHDVPVEVDLIRDPVLGISGSRPAALAIARSLITQATTLHGPSDLELIVATDHPRDWDWVKWLPHIIGDEAARRRNIVVHPDHADAVLRGRAQTGTSGWGEAEGGGSRVLLVIDVADVAASRHGALRAVLAAAGSGPVSALAVAGSVTDLPSACTTIFEVGRDGRGTLRVPARADRVADIVPWGVSAREARVCARAVGRFADPDAAAEAGDVPDRVDLVGLLGVEPAVDALIERWAAGDSASGLAAPVGAGPDGPLVIDLVSDGPHGLLAGTTGSGKSELLRTLVASLAATVGPQRLNFVLIDYKGGSAFDACAALPHTVGMVTDLDGHLARRALICLEAELRHRELVLRHHGADGIGDLVDGVASPALPRLVVVIDEFAALAKEYPEFMASLVDIAQRGRSLGVHLLLATQRPSGVISENIRANTNLRISLRVQDTADSVDVLGVADAAAIARTQPGRGLVRRGPGEVVPFQTALVTGTDTAGETLVCVTPFVCAPDQPPPARRTPTGDVLSDLERLVEAAVRAARRLELPTPRRPWPEPLPEQVGVDELDVGQRPPAPAAPLGLADEPHRQRRVTRWWTPRDGCLVVYGVAGSGSTTLLTTLVTGLAGSASPDQLHVYVLDFDDQRLALLAELPHVGAVIGSSDRERQLRLLRMLRQELDHRRDAGANGATADEFPHIVVCVDNYGGFASAFSDPTGTAAGAAMGRLIADGPGVGISVVLTAKQPTDVPHQIASVVPGKIVMRLADRYEYAGLGLGATDPPDQPGRGFETDTGRELQVALADPASVAGRAVLSTVTSGPWRIGVLPAEVKIPDVVETARVFDLEWCVPMGVGDTDLAPAGFVLREGDHALIAGPTRSGRSTALLAAAEVVKHARPDVHVSAVAPRRSPLTERATIDLVIAGDGGLEALREIPSPHLILVDDAELVADEAGVLTAIVASSVPGRHVLAAGAADLLRGAYGHWTQQVRRSRRGIALHPNVDTDGDLWQVRLPRRGPATWVPGRGYLVADGACELIQVAWR